jgi:hypothetical protein
MRALVLVLLTVGFAAVAGPASAAAADPMADLRISPTSWPGQVPLGSDGELTWTVTNAGTAATRQVSFRVTSTSGLAFPEASSDDGGCWVTAGTGTTVGCEIPAMAPGQSVTVRASYSGARQSTGQVTASVTSGGGDLNLDDNSVSATVTVGPPAGPIAIVRAGAAEHILRTGGLRVQVTPAFAGTYGVDASIRTSSGTVSLVHVDLRDIDAGKAQSVFLGTLPAALSRIRRSLRSSAHLRAVVTVTWQGQTVQATVPVSA